MHVLCVRIAATRLLESLRNNATRIAGLLQQGCFAELCCCDANMSHVNPRWAATKHTFQIIRTHLKSLSLWLRTNRTCSNGDMISWDLQTLAFPAHHFLWVNLSRGCVSKASALNVLTQPSNCFLPFAWTPLLYLAKHMLHGLWHAAEYCVSACPQTLSPQRICIQQNASVSRKCPVFILKIAKMRKQSYTQRTQ